MSEAPHIPVLLDEVLDSLSPKDGEVYVDGTFGAGGYTRAILSQAQCSVYGFDRDALAYQNALTMAEEFPERLIPVHSDFGSVAAELSGRGVDKVDGIVVDLGVSSMQIDTAERGFSFQQDGPLDMRMDQSAGQSAADLVATASQEELADIFFHYGEERKSRRVAQAIINAREENDITTTLQLAEIVSAAMPPVRGHQKKHPATKIFQALRIAVNDELGQLKSILEASLSLLKENGRLVVVSFHSLEDGIVKRFLREHAGMHSSSSRHLPDLGNGSSGVPVHFSKFSKKAVEPSDAEIERNPRSRSSRLRYAVRSDVSYNGVEGAC